jgi:hypothetical protein
MNVWRMKGDMKSPKWERRRQAPASERTRHLLVTLYAEIARARGRCMCMHVCTHPVVEEHNKEFPVVPSILHG